MIVLDTHIWLWWVNQDGHLLKPRWRELIETTLALDGKLISADSKFPLYAELAGRLID